MKPLEQYLDALSEQDWDRLSTSLADDVCRTGPYADVVQGKQAYVEFLSRVIPSLANWKLSVSRIRKLEGGSALVELSETVEVDGMRTEFPEALVFDFDTEGLIQRIDIFIKQPPQNGRANDDDSI